MASSKTNVIEYLFDLNWDDTKGSLRKTLMSLEDVAEAIRKCNEIYGTNLSARNPANFMKDFLRGANASNNWPASVAAKRYTARQRTGGGDVFEFVPYLPNQTEPFPDAFKIRHDAPRYPVQSISLPLVTKTLGRSDETWLVQTAVNLRVVETHFAVAAAFRLVELSHLQMGIKLRQTEIDALFLGKVETIGSHEAVIITCEAKHYKDPIIPTQVINQVQAAFTETDVSTVVPIGLRAVRDVGFYLTEFEAVSRADASSLEDLRLAADAIYELCPAVKGI